MKKCKSRILMIAPLPPPVHGSAMMTQYIKDSESINDRFELDWVNLSTSRKIEEIGKTSFIKLWRFANSYASTFWKLLTHSYDCCYLAITCHGLGFLKDAPFVLMCKLFGRKVVIHQHNKGMAADVNRPLFRWLLPLVYRNTKVILLSWRLYPDVEKVVKKEQVLICPNGIPEVEYKPRERENAIPRLLFLSNLIESKGVFVLLDACKILKDKGYIYQCNFVGGETKEIDRARFEAEVKRRGLDEPVIYLGRKYGEEKNETFNQSDIFVLPTLNDTFGLVLLEAMQQFLPCVTTDEGGIPDVVIQNKTGLISKKGDAQDLSKCLEKLLQDPSLRKIMGQEGYEHFKKNYTQQKFEECMLSILTHVTGGGKFVNYLGRKYGEEKESVLRESDIFVFPSYYNNETFGLVLLEAMQQFLPCVTTDEGGIPDVVIQNKTGLISKKGDAQDLSKCLEKLLQDPSLRKIMGQEGYEHFKKNYTQQKFEECMLSILTHVTGVNL